MIADYSFKQNTEEWLMARLGIPTASAFDRIIGKMGKKSSQRDAYMEKLAGERITQQPDTDGFSSPDTQRGHLLEPASCSVFEMTHKVKLLHPGIVYKDEKKLFSCSPDGLIEGREEGFETKARKLTASVHHLRTGNIDAKEYVQVQGSMLVTGYKVWHLCGYHPGLKYFHKIIEADEKYLAILEDALLDFCYDLDRLEEEVRVA